MPVEQRFKPQRRRVAWGATLLGTALCADAAWCVSQGQLAAALVVGGVGLERLVYAAADAWHERVRSYRLQRVRLDAAGMWFEEFDPYRGTTRETLLPGGLLLDANVQRGEARGEDAPWVVVVYSILGTFQWSSHAHEDAADAELARVRGALAERVPAELSPPTQTGRLDVLPQRRAVMWGVAPVLARTVALRAVLLLLTIVAVPQLAGGITAAMLWGLTGITAALLAFPFLGAAIALKRAAGVMAYGVVVQDGELRALERSAVTHAARVSTVRHIGLDDIVLSGAPLSLRLVGHLERGAQVDAIVPRAVLVNLAQQAFRAVAELHERGANESVAWAVPLPGGIAEGIEAASWAQRFVAEAQGGEVGVPGSVPA